MTRPPHYTPGQTQWFIHLNYIPQDPEAKIFVPWTDDLQGMVFRNLNCVEQLPFPPPEQKRAGTFVFEDETGDRWETLLGASTENRAPVRLEERRVRKQASVEEGQEEVLFDDLSVYLQSLLMHVEHLKLPGIEKHDRVQVLLAHYHEVAAQFAQTTQFKIYHPPGDCILVEFRTQDTPDAGRVGTNGFEYLL